jgi:hypothetical protein
MDAPYRDPYPAIRKIVRSGDTWKAYDERGAYLLTLDDKGLRQLARVSGEDITVEIEGEGTQTKAVFVREGTVLIFRGFEIYEEGGALEIQPSWYWNLEFGQTNIRSKTGLPLHIDVGTGGTLALGGEVLDASTLTELEEARRKVDDLETRLAELEAMWQNAVSAAP